MINFLLFHKNTGGWKNFLFKQAYQLLINREHLTPPEGLRKIRSIKASINNGLSEPLKKALSDVTFAIRPRKEKIYISNPQ